MHEADFCTVDVNKPAEAFRAFTSTDNPQFEVVRNHYRLMRSNQCMDFVHRMMAKVSTCTAGPSTIHSLNPAYPVWVIQKRQNDYPRGVRNA